MALMPFAAASDGCSRGKAAAGAMSSICIFMGSHEMFNSRPKIDEI